MISSITRRGLLAGAAAGVALAACGRAPTAARRSPVTLMLDWYPNADHAGIYGALAGGALAQHGLNLDIQTPSSTTDQIKLVGAGKVDFAVSYEPDLLLARAQGVPVEAVFALVQEPLNCVIALQTSGITHPAQLQGRRVGTSGTPGDSAILDAVVRADGGDPARVKNINVGFNLVQSLLGGSVDAIVGGYWNWEAEEITQAGHPVNVMRLQDWGVPDYDELVLITRSSAITGEAATVRALAAALGAGTAWAVAHPQQVLTALLQANPSLSRALVSKSLQDLAPAWNASGRGYGWMDPAAWATFGTWMLEEKWLPAKVDARAALSDAYLPRG